MKSGRVLTNMPTQEPVLSSSTGNKGRKKATGKGAKGRNRGRLAEEDRQNATLELAMEEEKENTAHSQSSDREDEDRYDLAMEERSDEEMDSPLGKTPSAQGTYVSETPKKSGTTSFPDPCTPTKSKSVSTFDPDVIIDSPKNRGSFKRPAADSPSSFGALFLSRKSARVDPSDNGLLLQLMEKIDTLSKITIEQSEHIKRLEDKIDGLTRTDMKAGLGSGTSTQPTMASQVAAFASLNHAPGTSVSFASPATAASKPVGGPHLSIDFSKCTPAVIQHSLSDLRSCLQASLSACHGTKEVKIKGMNRDAKNNQRVFVFFASGVEESKARIHEEEWLKPKFPQAKIQSAATFPVKINGARATAVLDPMTGRILESARTAIGEENKCTIAKLGWLSKRDSGKLYGSMVVHLASKALADKFLEQGLFEVGGESAYTDVWHDTNPSDRRCFNCQQFGHKGEKCTNPAVCGNCAALGHTHIECDNPIVACANCQGKHRARDPRCPASSFSASCLQRY